MPKGPRGEKRPADVIGNAVHVMRIATGDRGHPKQSAKAGQGRQSAGTRAHGRTEG
jgi:hypothetical protein